MENNVTMSISEIRSMLCDAFDDAHAIAQKSCDGYVAYNPTDAKNRRFLLDIEKAGINNLMQRILEQINRAEKARK